jgi:predicted  nucleic acid-binding Zn-ribbon protein
MDVTLSTSSPARRVRALTDSRQKWKDRVAANRRDIRRLRVRVRDLEASRDSWKRRALAAEAISPGEVLASRS